MNSFLLYYAIPLLHDILPKCYLDHLMLLDGGVHRLLSSSISYCDLNDTGGFLKLFVAQSIYFFTTCIIQQNSFFKGAGLY